MKKELHFAKAKSKNHPDATKPTLNFNDEVGNFQSKKLQWWKQVPEDPAKEITKETCKKFGV